MLVTRKKGLFAVLGSALLLAGCATPFEPKPIVTDIKAESAISTTSSMTHTLVMDRETPFVTCAMPPPDAGFSQQESGNVAVSLISVGGTRENESGAEEEGTAEDELAGRTPAVLMARELFFRLCEFSRNYQLNKTEALKLYRETLTAVKGGWDKEAGKTSVKIGDAVTTIINNTSGGKVPLPANTTTLDGGTTATGGTTSSTSTGTSSGTSTSNPFGSSTSNPFGN